MKTRRIILGLAKILLAVCIAISSFDAVGSYRGISIWLGLVVAFPILLWGILDLVKKDNQEKNDNEDK